MKVNRRQFLGTSALAAAPFFIAGCASAAKAYKVNGIVKIGVIGSISTTMDMPGVIAFPDKCRITAVCDLDAVRLAHGKKFVEERYAKKGITQSVATYSDYIDMIDNAGIDAVMVCVPDHWHALCAAAAIAAGMERLIRKCRQTDCWNGKEPQILAVCPPPMGEGFHDDVMGEGCREKSLALPGWMEAAARRTNARFLNAADCEFNPADHMHLSRKGHAQLAALLVPLVRSILD